MRASIRDFAVPGGLALVDLLRADGTGNDPGGPPAGLLDRPLRQVQVEGPHRGQALAVADPLDGDDGLLARAGHDGLRPGPQALLPGFGDLARAGAGCDAGVMALEVFPEPAAQGGGKLPQAAVIQRGLSLLQVVHQQVADWPAGEVVTVDQLFGRALARACRAPAASAVPRPRSSPSGAASGRDPGPCAIGLACALASASSSSRTSPTVMSPEQAALGADDDGAAVQDVCPGLGVRRADHGRTAPAAGRTRPDHGPACIPVTRGPPRITEPANQLSEGRTTSAQITVSKRRGQPPRRASGVLAAAGSQPAGTSRQPRPAVSAPLASHRSCQLSPGWSSSQSSSQASPSARCLLAAGASRCERRAGQPLEVSSGLPWWPASRRHRTRGKPGAHARAGEPEPGNPAHPAPGRGHDAPFPNRTSSVSGR